MVTRAEVRAFGRDVAKGDTFINRYKEHQHLAGDRELTVVADIRKLPFFILEDQDGKTTWMRTRTLMLRYTRIQGPRYRRVG